MNPKPLLLSALLACAGLAHGAGPVASVRVAFVDRHGQVSPLSEAKPIE